MSWDGQIAAAGGSSTWVTGALARRHAHRLRFTHDAVLVGAGTIRRDDPRLTVRLDGTEAARCVVVLSESLDLPVTARIFAARPRIYTGRAPEGPLAAIADVIRVATTGAGLDLAEVLRDLARQGVQSVLVEGGGRTHAAFLEAGLADDVVFFVAPRLIGATGGTPLLAGPAAASPDGAWALADLRTIEVGADLLVTARPER